MNHKEIPQLHKIAALTKFAFGCELYDLRGVNDSAPKIAACYLAQKLTKADHKTLGKFFNIYPPYMQNRVESYAVQLLLDQKAKQIMEQLENLFWEMEFANVRC